MPSQRTVLRASFGTPEFGFLQYLVVPVSPGRLTELRNAYPLPTNEDSTVWSSFFAWLESAHGIKVELAHSFQVDAGGATMMEPFTDADQPAMVTLTPDLYINDRTPVVIHDRIAVEV